MKQAAKPVVLEGVTKRFGALSVVKPLSAAIAAGEFLTLLGPSGCGKTTLLRMIAGLEGVSGGRIHIGNVDATNMPPNLRDVGMMFQDYALFPHKTLRDNIGYGLKMRGLPKPARDQRSEEWLTRIGLPGHGQRRPHELSGGQRQRVALARALITEPGVLLLDEPLGALDANLRRQMQDELKRVHQDVGLTFIYVTHDQEEAMAMSERIAVMRDGRIEQIGTPREIYDRPANAFVATFVGACNLLRGEARRGTSQTIVALANEVSPLVMPASEVTGPVTLAIRPEAVRLALDNRAVNTLQATVQMVDFVGANLRVQARTTGGFEVQALLGRRESGTEDVAVGASIFLYLPAEAIVPLGDLAS